MTIAQLMQTNADLVEGHNRLIDLLRLVDGCPLPKGLQADISAVLAEVSTIEDDGVTITLKRPSPTPREEPGPFEA